MPIPSFAKINLNLKITWTRSNGYHEIDSIFHKISLADQIFFEDKNEWIEIRSSWEFRKIPTNSKNTCFKAAEEMRKLAKWKRWIKIEIEKNIPQKAGLGGGSSNAAEVLKFLNKHWELNLSEEKLIEIWAKIWADIPFFIKENPCQKVSGIWEKLEFSESKFSGDFIFLIKPNYIEIETKWAYWELDKFDFSKVKEDYENDFEAVIFSFFPDLKNIKEKLEKLWALKAWMSWSGSVIFGIFEEESGAKKAEKEFEGLGWSGIFRLL